MIRRILRIPWAGPAVVLALLFGTVELRPAWAEPVATPAAVSTTTADEDPLCIREGIAFADAIAEWWDAWDNYEWTVPGGTESEILAAADLLDQASFKVATTGVKLLLCLIKKLV